MEMTNAEKLIAVMLAEVLEGLETKGEIHPGFVKEAIFSDHLWGLEWRYPGVFGDKTEAPPPEVIFVADVLDMWSLIEDSYKKLPKPDQIRVDAEVPFGMSKFPGFDGNHETEYMSIARFLVYDLDRFTEFSGRDFNSHMPSVARYEAMLAILKSTRAEFSTSQDLSAGELIKIGKR